MKACQAFRSKSKLKYFKNKQIIVYFILSIFEMALVYIVSITV